MSNRGINAIVFGLMSEGQLPQPSDAVKSGTSDAGGGLSADGSPAQRIKKQSQLWLALSAISLVFFCSGCFGLGGAILCFLAAQDADRGDLDEARAKLKWARWVVIAGAMLGCVVLVQLLSIWLN